MSLEKRRQSQAFWDAMKKTARDGGPTGAPAERVLLTGMSWTASVVREDRAAFGAWLVELSDTAMRLLVSHEFAEGAALNVKVHEPETGERLDLTARVVGVELPPTPGAAWLLTAEIASLTREQRLCMARWAFRLSCEQAHRRTRSA